MKPIFQWTSVDDLQGADAIYIYVYCVQSVRVLPVFKIRVADKLVEFLLLLFLKMFICTYKNSKFDDY